GAEVRSRVAVEERRRVECVGVQSPLLCQESVDDEIIAQDPHAAFRRAAATGQSGRSLGASAELAENAELDRSPQRLGALIGIDGGEEKLGGWVLQLLRCWHDSPRFSSVMVAV